MIEMQKIHSYQEIPQSNLVLNRKQRVLLFCLEEMQMKSLLPKLSDRSFAVLSSYAEETGRCREVFSKVHRQIDPLCLLNAIQRGDWDAALQLIELEKIDLNARDQSGNSPLILSICKLRNMRPESLVVIDLDKICVEGQLSRQIRCSIIKQIQLELSDLDRSEIKFISLAMRKNLKLIHRLMEKKVVLEGAIERLLPKIGLRQFHQLKKNRGNPLGCFFPCIDNADLQSYYAAEFFDEIYKTVLYPLIDAKAPYPNILQPHIEQLLRKRDDEDPDSLAEIERIRYERSWRLLEEEVDRESTSSGKFHLV